MAAAARTSLPVGAGRGSSNEEPHCARTDATPTRRGAGAFLLGQMLKGATATYGLFGIVLGLLAWIYLGALTVMVCAEINVVREERMWPRSLLTPFPPSARTPNSRAA